MFKMSVFPMCLKMFVVIAAVVVYTDCHLSSSEQTTKQMSIELINLEPFHSLHTLECNEAFDEVYCLNGGRCFNITVATYSFPSCECATGFMGERCDRKYLDRSYNPEHYIKTDDAITSEYWSNIDKSRSMNNMAGKVYVVSGTKKGISVNQSVMLLAIVLLYLLLLFV